MRRSKLIQKQIYSVSKAEKEFEKNSTDTGANTNITTNSDTSTSNNQTNEVSIETIPIVLVPKSPSVVQLSATVPSGPFVLWQQWDRDMGELNPGVIWFWPAWNRVSHIVTRAPITYHAPIKDCPTADNGKE